MPSEITLQHIADEVGVSRTTVSYVLSGQAQSRRVSKGTAERIFEVARAHNYVPNAIARSLRRQRTGTVGILVSDFLLNVAHELFAGMEPVFMQHDRLPIFMVHNWNPERERRELKALLERRVEAILVANPLEANREGYHRLIDQGVTLIFLRDTFADAHWANFVVWDSGQAARAAVRHLIELGHRRIGLVMTDRPGEMQRERLRAYEQVLDEAGFDVRPEWRVVLPHQGDVDGRLHGWLSDCFREGGIPPDAVLTFNDGMVCRVCLVMGRLGLRVPDDMALMGMSDFEVRTHDGRGITTMEEPLEMIGAAGAEALLALEGGAPPPIQRRIGHIRLIERQTTRPAKAAV